MQAKFVSFLFTLGWAILKYLPEQLGRKIFTAIADRVYKKNGRSVQQLRANLKQVTSLTGENLERLTKAGVRSYFKYWYEAFVIHTWNKEKINTNFVMLNKDKLTEYLKNEKKVILVLPHIGNWDAAALWFTSNYQPLTTVAEKLKPLSLFEKFVRFRSALGVEVLALERGGGTYQQLKKRVSENKVVALLSDRDLSASGIKVTYFDAITSMPAGPSTLAWEEDATLVPINIFNSKDNKVFGETGDLLKIDRTMSREDSIKDLTQRMSSTFEKMVKVHPADWHLMQKVWQEVKPIKMG